MLTDILIASPGDAPGILSAAHGVEWPRLQFNSLDNTALAGLWAALGASPAEARDLEGERHLLAHTEGEWVFELPPDFVHRLAALPAQGIAGIAIAWAAHEEIAQIGASGPDLEPIVDALRGFAQQAIQAHKGLLLSMSL